MLALLPLLGWDHLADAPLLRSVSAALGIALARNGCAAAQLRLVIAAVKRMVRRSGVLSRHAVLYGILT